MLQIFGHKSAAFLKHSSSGVWKVTDPKSPWFTYFEWKYCKTKEKKVIYLLTFYVFWCCIYFWLLLSLVRKSYPYHAKLNFCSYIIFCSSAFFEAAANIGKIKQKKSDGEKILCCIKKLKIYIIYLSLLQLSAIISSHASKIHILSVYTYGSLENRHIMFTACDSHIHFWQWWICLIFSNIFFGNFVRKEDSLPASEHHVYI